MCPHQLELKASVEITGLDTLCYKYWLSSRSSEGVSKSVTLADMFKASGAPIACLCSSNEIYATEAEAATAALKKAGAKAVFLAGRAGEHENVWRKAGIDDFIFAGCDVLAALQQVHAILGLK